MSSPEEIAHCAYRAAVMEASAEKPGNVTPTHSFDGLVYQDFVRAAERLEPVIEKTARAGEKARVGKLIYEATSGKKNINFGIIIMFIPLAASRGGATKEIIGNLTPRDTRWIVRAMQKGRLGGMELKDKSLGRYDILSGEIFETIKKERITPLQLMEMSKSHDTLAREWVGDYPISRAISKRMGEDPDSIVSEYLRVLSEYPDTLIARKEGIETAKKVSKMARDVLNGILNMDDFDSYLRADGNLLNPGTTADLIATGLFLKLMGLGH